MQELIKKLLQPLKERGQFKSPEEVEMYFEEALIEAYSQGKIGALTTKENIPRRTGLSIVEDGVEFAQYDINGTKEFHNV